MKKKYKHSSEILSELEQDKDLTGDITFKEILTALGDRAFGLALLFFALPSALPISAIPGVALVFSIPIMIFAIQMILTQKTLWLPKIIANQTIPRNKMLKIIHVGKPYLEKIERLLKPRLGIMTSSVMEVVNGITLFYLALLLMLPIPMSNFIIAGLIILFALGLVEKDGLLIVLGYIGTILYTGVIYLVVFAAIKTYLRI